MVSIYLAMVVLAGVVSGIVFLLSLSLTLRRRELPYFLIMIALGSLTGRSVVAILDIIGIVGFHFHHTVEHALDAMIALALLAAVIAIGSIGSNSRGDSIDE